MPRSSYTPEENRIYLARRYAEQRRWMHDYLGQHACVICASTDDLQFDHIDPAAKAFNVGRLWADGDFLRVLAPELDKCQVLCGRHHREKSGLESSARRVNVFTHGTRTGWMKSGCWCDACKGARDAWNAERAARRRVLSGAAGRGPTGRPSTHGEYLHYRRGCKCDDCRAANAAKTQERRTKRDDASRPSGSCASVPSATQTPADDPLGRELIMAKRSILTDDINGGTDDVRTVRFVDGDGNRFKADLGEQSRGELTAALSDFIEKATPVAARAESPAASDEAGKVREWATANGHTVSQSGRISKAVRQAYDEAHPSEADVS